MLQRILGYPNFFPCLPGYSRYTSARLQPADMWHSRCGFFFFETSTQPNGHASFSNFGFKSFRGSE